MPFSEVGSGSQRAGASFITQVSGQVAFPGAVTAGSLLVVAGFANNNATGIGLTDTRGTVYTVVNGTAGPGGEYPFIGYGIAPSSGANTVTLTCTSGFFGFGVDEFAVVPGAVASVNGGTTTGTDSANPSDSITTATAGELIIASMASAIATSETITPNAAWTQIYEQQDGSTHVAGSVIFRIVSAAGAYTAAWTLVSSDWAAQTFSFRVSVLLTGLVNTHLQRRRRFMATQ